MPQATFANKIVFNPAGVAITNGSYGLDLVSSNGSPTIIDTGGAAPTSYTFNLDATGAFPQGSLVWMNASISPPGSTYTVNVWSGPNRTGTLIYGPLTQVVGPSAPFSGVLVPDAVVYPYITATINGVNTFSGTPAANTVLQGTSATTAAWTGTPAVSTLAVGNGTFAANAIQVAAANNGLWSSGAAGVFVAAQGTDCCAFAGSEIKAGSAGRFSFAASGGATASGSDTSVSRNSAGVVQFGTNAANALGSYVCVNGTHNALGTATSGGNFGSGSIQLNGSWWNGAAAVAENWVVNASPASTVPNPQNSFFNINHSSGIPNAIVQIQDLNPATAGANFSAPIISLVGHFWNGTVSTADATQLKVALGTGTNPTKTLTLINPAGGTSGTFSVDFTAAASLSCNAITLNGKNLTSWTFLGTASGTGVTVGPVVWTGTFRQFMIQYVIGGYSAGSAVGRLLVGPGAPSTTALTNGSQLSEGVTAPTTAASIPGMPLAVTTTAMFRQGWAFIDGASGSLKSIIVDGLNGNLAVATPPALFRGVGCFSDLSTNLPLQQAQLTVYDNLTAVAASTTTFTAGTMIAVWGRNTN